MLPKAIRRRLKNLRYRTASFDLARRKGISAFCICVT